MNLSDLNINQKAKVIGVTSSDDLKKRFYSFGITKGALVHIEEISLAKNTIEINVDDTSIALRLNEAKTILVELL